MAMTGVVMTGLWVGKKAADTTRAELLAPVGARLAQAALTLTPGRPRTQSSGHEAAAHIAAPCFPHHPRQCSGPEQAAAGARPCVPP